MLKVLIADSDMDSIRRYKTHIKASFSDIRIVAGVSDDSRDVGKLIKELSAQLIIADIRFFGLNGYKAILDLYNEFPDIRFILYGAYNDGEYMKCCLNYGVIDYLYKPVKLPELERCISTASSFFNKFEEAKKREAEIQKNYNERLYLYENIFFTNLVKGTIKNPVEIKRSFRYFNLDFNGGYTVLIIRIDHYQKVLLTLDDMEKHLLLYKMLLSVQKMLDKSRSASFSAEFNAVTVILGGAYNLDEIILLSDNIRNEIYNELGICVTVGTGRTYVNEQEIPVSYKEAAAALRYKFVMGYNSVIPIQFVEPHNKITYRYPLEREERLVYSAVTGEYEHCQVLLNELFGALRECGELPDKLISKIVMDILISINRYLSEQNIPLQDHFTSFFPSQEALSLNDLNAAYDYLDKALKNFCGYMIKHRDDDNKKLVQSAKHYLSEKYHQTFSLTDIAMKLNTTPEYLSKIFMDSEKMTLFDYSVKLRIDEAKKLMRETEFDDDMLAVKIGYDNGRHFRGVFKQITGMSTIEYRNRFSLFSNNLEIVKR